MFVKKNRQNRECRKRSGYTKKPSSDKGLLRERHLCATFKLYKNFFCQQRAGLEVLIKVTSKADRWNQSGKSFTFLRWLRSRRSSRETQKLNHTQGLSHNPEVNHREGKWARW